MFKFNSIKAKLTLTNIVVLLILTGLTFYIIINRNLDRLMTDLVHEVETYNVFISQDLVKIVVFDSVDIASDLTSRLRSFKKINYLVVFDNNKQPKFYYIKESLSNKKLVPNDWGKISLFTDESYTSLSSLKYLDKDFGYVFIDVSTESIEQAFIDYKKQGAAFIGALVIASLLLAMLFKYLVSTPISKLIEKLKFIAETSDFTSMLSIKRNDEIGNLFSGFNEMQKAIQLANKDLDDQKFALDEHAIVAVTDTKGNIIFVNDKFTEISGYSHEELLGKNHRILNSGVHSVDFFRNMYKTIASGKVWQGEVCNKDKNGRFYWVATTIVPLLSEDQKPERYIAIRTDITELKTVQKEAQYLSEHDVLTGLPNRTQVASYIEKALERTNRRRTNLALVFIDLNKFKIINDTMGHEAGDNVLISVSELLQKSLRKMDFIARHAGDEFVVIFEDVSDEIVVSNLLEKIIKAAEKPIIVNHKEIHIGMSMGVSMYPLDACDSQELFAHADAAMYKAKEHGHSNYQFYTKDLNQIVLQRYKLESELRSALNNNELFVVFQPKVDLLQGKIIGAEVLIRWQQQNGKFVSPADFIPVAESCGLINNIWLLALNQSAKFAKLLSDCNKNIPLAINVSPVQFKYGSITDDITSTLSQFSLPSSALEIEITEGLLIDSRSGARDVLDDLSSKGIKIAIDDFGTGYSSLKYLKEFAIDYVKLDVSFVSGIGFNKDDEKLIKTMIDMSTSLDKKVIAEGVETEKQRDYLISHGCDYAQGYFYSKPLVEEDFLILLNDGSDVILFPNAKNSSTK